MTFSWILRRYHEGDEHAILDLLNTAFARKWRRKWGSLEYWRWKYTKNPAGSPIIWLAERDGKIIGHYGIIPMTMKVGNSYVVGSFACDAATHPDYQGQGIFSSIVNRSCLDAGENGIPITYGFANTILGPTYRRYEHTGHICLMKRMIKVLEWEPVLARYMGNNFLVRSAAAGLGRMLRARPRRRLTIETIDRFDERTDALWEQTCRNFNIIVRRNRTYLNWRYADHPAKEYTIYVAVKGDSILGYCILAEEARHNLRFGLIADMLVFPDHGETVGCLIDRAVERFAERHVDAIICMISEQHPYAPLLRKAGFITYPRQITALYATINIPGFPIDQREVYSQALLLSQNQFLKQRSNWFMMHGDGDWDL